MLKKMEEIQKQKYELSQLAEKAFRAKKSYLRFGYRSSETNKNNGRIVIVSVNMPIHKIIFGWLRFYFF